MTLFHQLFYLCCSNFNPYIALAFFVLIYFARIRYHNGLHKIPGPFLASISSMWKFNIVRCEKMPFVNTRLHEQFGPLVRIGPNHISASSAEAIQLIHRAKTGFTKVTPMIRSFSPSNLYSHQFTEFCNHISKVLTCIMSFLPRTHPSTQF